MDVARASGMSDVTVLRVLSGYAFVRKFTRDRMMEAVERLGYVANLQARGLAGGRSWIVGLLVPNLGNSYVGATIRGIDQELERANCDLILYTSHHHPRKESFYVSAIANGFTEGLLLVASLVPNVLIDQADTTENNNIVELTNWQGAYEATCYLNQLGYTRIALIRGVLAIRSAVERLNGCKAALADCGIPFRKELVIEGGYQQQTGYETSKRPLQNVDPLPTAIFISNDLSAFGAMNAVRGLRISGDFSIIGFDDIFQAFFVYPRLTTIRQLLEQMGQVAIKMLLDRIEDRGHLLERVSWRRNSSFVQTVLGWKEVSTEKY